MNYNDYDYIYKKMKIEESRKDLFLSIRYSLRTCGVICCIAGLAMIYEGMFIESFAFLIVTVISFYISKDM